MELRDVQINNSYDKLIFSEESLQSFFKILDSLPSYSIPKGELSIAFVDNAMITKIHADFLNDPTPTDVITFPPDPAFDLAGEICVCVDHAIKHSQNLNIPFNKELALYLIHGWLHLAGYNDLTDQQVLAMRRAEKDILEMIEKAGTIPDFHLL